VRVIEEQSPGCHSQKFVMKKLGAGRNGQSCPYLEAVGTMSLAEAVTKAVTKYQELDRQFRGVKCSMRKGLQ
jgi:hypothetical protein